MNVFLKLIAIGISLGIVLAFAGCESQGPAEQTGRQVDQAVQKAGETAKELGSGIVEQTEKAGEYLDDAAVTAKVKEEIMKDPILQVLEISVTTTNGTVTLNGSVDTESSIDRAAGIARAVEGVKSVENNLVVKEIQ